MYDFQSLGFGLSSMACGTFGRRRSPVHPRAPFSLFFATFAISNIEIFMSEQQVVPENQLNIELTEEVADGTYANLAIITHSFAEFVIDFVNVMPNVPKSKVKARIVMTPQHAKRVMRALIDNVKRFESQYGNIKDQEMPAVPFNFGTPPAQA